MDAKTNAAAREYKLLKEAFVSGLNGGSVGEINAVALVLPASAFLWSALQSQQDLFEPYGPFECLIDFLLNVCAILFATTLYSSQPLVLCALLILPGIFILVASKLITSGARNTSLKKDRHRKHADSGATTDATMRAARADDASLSSLQTLPVKPFLTTYRGALLVITSVCILAVDFRVFPRRFAKVETWGTSLMDVGVGSFVFSAGVTAARPMLKAQMRAAAATSTRASLARRLMTAARHALPLLLLGAARTYSVKGLDYAEHVTEYGVHWNFFFTLALLPPCTVLSDALLAILPSATAATSRAALALLVATAYQVALDSTELKAYILTAPRHTSLVAANREGLFSFAGYLAVFLAGQSTGAYILPPCAAPRPSPRGARSSSFFLPRALRNALVTHGGPLRSPVTRKLAVACALWTALAYLTASHAGAGVAVSRRLANLPYVLWIAAFNTAQLALTAGIEAALFPDVHFAPPPPPPSPAKPLAAGAKTTTKVAAAAAAETHRRADRAAPPPATAAAAAACSPLLAAFNRNGLALFLLANVLTGGVNLAVPTLRAGDAAALAVLLAYMAVLAGAALALDRHNVVLKL